MSPDKAFPIAYGPVRLKSSIIPFGNVRKGEEKTISVPVINSSKSPVTLSIGNLPNYISATLQPATIASGKEAIIAITFKSAFVEDWAFKNDRLLLMVNGDAVSSKNYNLNVTSFISEDFSKLTPEQKKRTPIGTLVDKEVKLGKVKVNGTLTGSFGIKNTGKSTLQIRKIFSDCNCITCQVPRQGIPAGQTTTIRFTIKSGNTTGQKIENLNIMTNSPSVTDLQLPVGWEVIQ